MRTEPQTRTATLSGEDIDLFSDWLERVQLEVGVERQNRLRLRLFTEEILLRMRDRLGEQPIVTITCENRLGRPHLRIEVESRPYNPLGSIDTELGSWESSFATSIGFSPQYSYIGGRNYIRLSLPRAGMNPVLRIAIAIALGALLGMAGQWIIPLELRQVLATGLLTPAYRVWNRMLNAISGPIIFLTVVTTMLNTRKLQARGGSSVLVIVRYFAISFLVVGVALLCSLPLFSLGYAGIELDQKLVVDLFDNLLKTVPSNIFEPFVESNTSQLLFLAFTLGYVLTKLGDQVGDLRKLIRQANVVGLKVASWMSWFVPLITGTFLCLELWESRLSVAGHLWKPLMTALAISVAMILASVLVVARNVRTNPLLLLRKMWRPFKIAVKTGSLDGSFGEAQLSCTKQLGIDSGFVKIALPQGLVLFMPVSAIGTIVFTLFAAQQHGVLSSPVWYVTAVVMAVVVFVATPPVPGANLLAYVVLFTTLGIPDAALLDAMIYDIIFGIFASAANQTMLQLEMLVQAQYLGLLESEVLHRT